MISNPSGDGRIFEWKNRAGVSWTLAPNMNFLDQPHNAGVRIGDFDVGTNCPYYNDGHKNADLKYNANGTLYNVKGPWGEVYNHVISFTPV